MKKLVSIILAITMILTLCISMPMSVSAATIDESALYPVVSTDLRPTSPSAWGWSSITQTQEADGVRFVYSGTESWMHNFTSKALTFSGAHIRYTINNRTGSASRVGFFISNESSNGATSGLFMLPSHGNERQFVVMKNAYSYSKAVSTQGNTYQYPGLSDRLYLPETAMSNDINEYELQFVANANGSVTVSINGIGLDVSAADVAAANLDVNKPVYLHFGFYSGAVDFTVNSIHGGDVICEKTINDINAGIAALDKSSADYLKKAVALYAKVSELPSEAKAYIVGYADLAEAAYTATDAKAYLVTDADVTDWWNFDSYDENGMRINISANPFVFRHTYKAKVVDGLTAGYTLNAGTWMGIALSNGTVDSIANTKLYVRFEGASLYVYAGGSRVNSFDYASGLQTVSDTDVRVKVGNLNANGTKNTFSFDIDDENRFSMYINDVIAFTFSAETTAAMNLSEKLNLQIAPHDSNLDMVLHYVRGGDEITMDAPADSLYYKATTNDIHSYWNYETDVEDGVKIVVDLPFYDYRHTVDRKVAVDGLNVNYTHNGGAYYLALTSGVGKMHGDSYLSFRFERGNNFVYIYKNGVQTTDFTVLAGELFTVSETDKRLTSALINTNDVDISFKYATDGGLILVFNGTDLLKVNAATVAASGLPKNNVYVQLAPYAKLDIVLHYVRSGYYAKQVRIEKPFCIAGDANADGEVNIIDLVRAKNYSLDDSVSTFVSAIDLSSEGEGRINALDITELKKLVFANF